MANRFSDALAQPLSGKVCLVRVDFNVPIKHGVIVDDTRLRSSVGTIQALQKKGAKVVLISHLKRPDGTVIESLRLRPIADALSQLLNCKVTALSESIGDSVLSTIHKMKNGDVILLENIRFYKEELTNDPEFSKTLASYADYFIQDAFGTVHRAHASTVGLPQILPAFSGQLLDKEMDYFNQIMTSPKQPFTAIVGGAKISTKFSVLNALLSVVDALILGGAMVYTILQAQGLSTGASLVEPDLIPQAKELLKKAEKHGKTILIPEDHVVVPDIHATKACRVVASDAFAPQDIGVDIGPASIQAIERLIGSSSLVFWNGPVGIFEVPEFSHGTTAIAKSMATSGAITIVGGGDSVAALNQSGVSSYIQHVSTGGGASLEYLEGRTLPGIQVLQ